MRTVPLVVAFALVVSGCSFTTKKYSCAGGRCHVSVQGEQTVDLDGVQVEITDIGAGDVTLRVDGSSPAKVREGASGPVGPATVKVTEADGDKATFDIS